MVDGQLDWISFAYGMNCNNVAFKRHVRPSIVRKGGKSGYASAVGNVTVVVKDPKVQPNAPNLLFRNDAQRLRVNTSRLLKTSFNET